MDKYKAISLNGEEVYGELFHNSDTNQCFIIKRMFTKDNEIQVDACEVERGSLCRQTGFLDMTNKPLFENDIVYLNRYFFRICRIDHTDNYELVTATGTLPFIPSRLKKIEQVFKIQKDSVGTHIVHCRPSLTDVVGENAYLTIRDAEDALRIKRVSELL
jgi:hypothetical protein